MIYAPATLFLLKRVAGRTYCIKKCGPVSGCEKLEIAPGSGRIWKDSYSVKAEISGMQRNSFEILGLEGFLHYK